MARRVKKGGADSRPLGTLRDNDGEQVNTPKKCGQGEDPAKADALRWWRYDARRQSQAWLLSACSTSRLTICGLPDYGYGFVNVKHREGELSARFGHIMRCGSVFSCPVCGSKIRAERGEELRQALRQHFAAAPGENGAIFMTVTLSHSRGEECGEVLRRLSHTPSRKRGENEKDHAGAWRRFTKSAAYRGDKRSEEEGFMKRAGVVGCVSCLECTYGSNGWHWHKHICYLVRGLLTGAELLELEKGLRKAWSRAVESAGGSCSEERGLVLDQACDAEALADYLTKAPSEALAGEIARGDLKYESAGLDPWGLLRPSDEAVQKRTALGVTDAMARRLWLDFTAATKGKHFMDWSPGLRAALGMEQEKSDQDIAEASESEEREEIAYISPRLYTEATETAGTVKQMAHDLAEGKFDDVAEMLGATVGEWAGLPMIYRPGGYDSQLEAIASAKTPREAEQWTIEKRRELGEARRRDRQEGEE